MNAQPDLFGSSPPAWPAGFAYRDEVISPAEEQALVERIAPLPFKPYEFRGYLGRRHTVSFGYRYDFHGRRIEIEPIPDFLLLPRARAAAFAGLATDDLQQVLINRYAPGAGIGWHRDRPMFRDVVAISLLAPCTLRLRRAVGDGWERRSVEARARSAYLLRGEVRSEWEHSIPPLDALRYSITFRNFS